MGWRGPLGAERVMSESLGVRASQAWFLPHCALCRGRPAERNCGGLQLRPVQTLWPWEVIKLSCTCEMRIIKIPTSWCY